MNLRPEALRRIRDTLAAEAVRDLRTAARVVEGHPTIGEVLELYAEHWSSPGFSFEAARRMLRSSTKRLAGQFGDAVGVTPGRYLRNLRLRVAHRLLTETRVPVSAIPGLVGFSAGNFRKSFRSATGMSPSEARSRGAAERDRQGLTPEIWSQVMVGAADSEAARRALHALVEMYPEARDQLWAEFTASAERGDFAAMARLFAPEDLDGLCAAAMWREIADLPFAAQVDAVRHHCLGRPGGALVRVLAAECSRRGAVSRGAAVEIAHLAVIAAKAAAEPDTEGRCNLEAEGYLVLANSLRRAMDFPGAERATRAAKLRAIEDEREMPGRILCAEAMLQYWQRRDSAEVVATADAAVAASRLDERLAVEALVIRAQAREYHGDTTGAAADCEEAWRRLPPRLRRSRLAYALAGNHALVLIDLGQGEAAARMVQLARETLVASGATEEEEARVCGIEARLLALAGEWQKAASRFAEVEAEFARLGRAESAGMVALHRALALREAGDVAGAAECAARASAVLHQIATSHPEGLAAEGLRREAVEALALIEKALTRRLAPGASRHVVRRVERLMGHPVAAAALEREGGRTPRRWRLVAAERVGL